MGGGGEGVQGEDESSKRMFESSDLRGSSASESVSSLPLPCQIRRRERLWEGLWRRGKMRGREVKRQQERQTQLPFCMLSLFLSLIALNSMLIGRTIELRPENLPTNDAFARRSLWVARRGIWPTVFIIGSPKAGTTSLAALLFNHSKFCAPRQAAGNKVRANVCAVRAPKQEVNFFNIKQNFQRGTKYYLSFFGKDPKCQRYKEGFHEYVDATPTYLRSAGGGDRMKEA
eukprot:759212-Hanusia_phi.AAC.3